MTIREWVARWLLEVTEERLVALQKMNAPKVMIDGVGKQVEQLKNGKVKIGGDVEVLDETFVTVERKKGRDGVTYYHINGNVNFFPKARYGMYIKNLY